MSENEQEIRTLTRYLRIMMDDNMDAKKIARVIESLDARTCLLLCELSRQNQCVELERRIQQAIKINKQKRIGEFQQSLKNGTFHSYLEKISIDDKIQLMIDLGFSQDTDRPNMCRSILENSILKDIKSLPQLEKRLEEEGILDELEDSEPAACSFYPTQKGRMN